MRELETAADAGVGDEAGCKGTTACAGLARGSRRGLVGLGEAVMRGEEEGLLEGELSGEEGGDEGDVLRSEEVDAVETVDLGLPLLP